MTLTTYGSRPRARHIVCLAMCAAIVVSVPACGREADPKDVAALSKEFQASDGPLSVPLTKDQSACRAEVLLEADLSPEALKALKETGTAVPVTKDDREALREITDDLAACI